MSRSLSLAPTYRPPRFEGAAPRHICGCGAKSVIRLQSAAGELRSLAADTSPPVDALDTVINIALIGGAVYLVYEIFLG